MQLFGSKKSYIGADLGTSSIKMVELENKSGRAILSTYGYVEQPIDIIRSSSDTMEDKIVSIIRAIHSQSRMKSKEVIAALPSFSVFNSILSLPKMDKKDLSQAIQWEAKSLCLYPLKRWF